MIDLDQPPCCPTCGHAPLAERYWPPVEEDEHHCAEPPAWSYACDGCGIEDPRAYLERLTWRTAPWTRILADEIARMRSREPA